MKLKAPTATGRTKKKSIHSSFLSLSALAPFRRGSPPLTRERTISLKPRLLIEEKRCRKARIRWLSTAKMVRSLAGIFFFFFFGRRASMISPPFSRLVALDRALFRCRVFPLRSVKYITIDALEGLEPLRKL